MIIIKERNTYYRGSSNHSVGNTAREALDNWKRYKPDEANEKYYTYLGIISLSEAEAGGYHNKRPKFDAWVEDVFLEWVKQPGNFVPLDGPTVQLEERAGGRLHLSVG